jgi:hypothetical protein
MRNGTEIFCLGWMRIWHIKVIYEEAILAIGEIAAMWMRIEPIPYRNGFFQKF